MCRQWGRRLADERRGGVAAARNWPRPPRPLARFILRINQETLAARSPAVRESACARSGACDGGCYRSLGAQNAIVVAGCTSVCTPCAATLRLFGRLGAQASLES